MMTALVRDVDAYLMADTEPLPCALRLGWNSDNPFAVELLFRGPHGDVRWLVARELLAESLITWRTLGEGDIRVQRYRNACALRIDLRAPSGQCTAATCTTPLTEFLNATYRMSPAGGPEEAEAVDHALGVLLAQVNE